MPSDIRSFFGGKSANANTPAKKEEPKKKGRPRKVIEDDDDDDDEPAPKKATPKKTAAKKKKKPEPELEETTASSFFGDNKPKRSEAVRPKKAGTTIPESTPKKPASKAKANGKSSIRSNKETSYVNFDVEDFPDDDMREDAEDEFKAAGKVGKRRDDDYEPGTDGEDDMRLVPKKRDTGKQTKLQDDGQDDADADGDVDMKGTNPHDDEVVEMKPAKKAAAKPTKKRKSTAWDDDDDDLEVEQAKPAAKKRAPATKKTKKDAPQDSAEVKAIFDSIPTITPPPPPDKNKDDGDGEKAKFQFGAQHANSAVPAGAMSDSDLPVGQDNCLAGLDFVFTGQLERLGRDQGQNLVKRYGGSIKSAPSGKTSYVVLGEDAGPKKLDTIAKHKLKVINEDGLFELIRRMPANGGSGAAAEKYAEKIAKEEQHIREQAAELDREEAEQKAIIAAASAAKAAKQSPVKQTSTSASAAAKLNKGKEAVDGPDSRLWTVKYAPTQMSMICGNKGQVDKLQAWLRAFPKSQRTGFKMGGPNGSGVHRAVMIHGPPGIGKTTAAHLVAKMEGYDIVESNASDTRSKKLVETGLKGTLAATSLLGYFGQGDEEVKDSNKKICLIMDEVDGMSAGDRGGVGALAAVCKKTQVPMILICNDRKLPKMKPFDFCTFDLPFRRPTTDQIRGRIMTIAFRENMKLPTNVVNALIEGSGADIRQVINMVSQVKLDDQAMSFEGGRDMSKAWEKHTVLKPWDMVGKILGGELFNEASKTTLNEKTELYFNDHEFAPLMLQENYLGTNPQRSNKYNGEPSKKRLAALELASKAADSISDGDLVDRMIHGSQQQWSLMPAHAVFSFVRPASFVYGTMAGHQTRFTAWLGNNSKTGKLSRFIKEIQGHMRLRISADKNEIRQTYLPILFEKLVKRLQDDGKEAVPDIIELMDSYYLSKDDWDAILELGVGKADMESIKIETQAKATFTRQYNQMSHPLPFMKASHIVAPIKAAAKEKPDIEEAFEESADEAEPDAAAIKKEQDDENDLSKDKYVAKPKKRKAAATKAGASKKKKTSKDDDDDDEEEVEKPNKGKGKARAKK